MNDLTYKEKDILNVLLRWFGGNMNALDCFVASIPTYQLRNLSDRGMVRKRWIGWEITHRGIRALEDAGVTSLRDTRRF